MIIITLLSLLFITYLIPYTRDFYISLYYCFKNPKDPFDDFYGMLGFAGYYGQGKSMAMSHTILRFIKLAAKHNKELKIYTNYHFNGQTGQLTTLNDIEKICDEKVCNKKRCKRNFYN